MPGGRAGFWTSPRALEPWGVGTLKTGRNARKQKIASQFGHGNLSGPLGLESRQKKRFQGPWELEVHSLARVPICCLQKLFDQKSGLQPLPNHRRFRQPRACCFGLECFHKARLFTFKALHPCLFGMACLPTATLAMTPALYLTVEGDKSSSQKAAMTNMPEASN